MYGVGPSVANVTANGEEIVRVAEWGLCSEVVYTYSNNKQITIYLNKNAVTNIDVCFIITDLDGKYKSSERYKYNNLTKEQKEKFFPNEEKNLLIQDALRRYRADHRKPKGIVCNLL